MIIVGKQKILYEEFLIKPFLKIFVQQHFHLSVVICNSISARVIIG
jgi:hypothetical protein